MKRLVGLASRAEHWGTTEHERLAARRGLSRDGGRRRVLTRAIDVDAPADTVFRWVCQLKVAPYSYDWLNNLGRRSPRRLTEGADRLALGQRFLSLRVVRFEPGREIEVASSPRELALLGVVGFAYRVDRRRADRSRILVRIEMAEPSSSWAGARHVALAWGDLVMIRKQLRTLKSLAERRGAG